MNAKEFKCPFELWETHESMFPIYLDSLPMKFQALLVHKLRLKVFFSLTRILSNIRRCCSQLDNLNK